MRRAAAVHLNPQQQDIAPSLLVVSPSDASHRHAAVVHAPFRARAAGGAPSSSPQGLATERSQCCVFHGIQQPDTAAAAFTTREVHHHSVTFAVTSGTPSSCHSSGSRSWDPFISFFLSCMIGPIASSCSIPLLLHDHLSFCGQDLADGHGKA